MKIIYHDTDDVIYTQIARLDFSPGVDMTLNSLPVDTLSADIITPDTLERGWLISLKNDVDTLFAKFKITKVQRINKDTLRVEAQSPLGLMDWWTVGAERIQTTAGAAVYDLFNGLPKSGYLSIIPYTLPTDLASVNINGFAPEQTARERLLWLCLAMGAWVQQSFCNGMVFHALPDLANLSAGKLIPIRNTYWKPDTQMGDPVYEVDYEFTQDMSTTEDYEDMQSGTDESGTTYYWLTGHWVRTNPAVDMPGGSEVKYAGVTLLSNNSEAADIIDKLTRILMNRLEITAEVIDNGDIQPGDVVRVYTDEHLIYHGIVKQCTFTFGQQAKARLTISASPDALPIQIVRVLYTADGVPLGQHTEVFPEGDTWEIENPAIGGYSPEGSSITGSTGGTYTVDYTKLPLVWIEAHNNSFTQYLEGKNISYARLLVLGYQTPKTAAIQVKWTNGGQWIDGKIPFEALTLPVTKAVYDPTAPSQEYPGASIQTIPVQYIDDEGTTFEDTFNVIVWENKPVSLQIMSLPEKLEYHDGEEIQYDGLVVRALLQTGQPWEDDEHPGGIIPNNELTLPDLVADITKITGDEWDVSGLGVTAPVYFHRVTPNEYYMGTGGNGSRYFTELNSESPVYMFQIRNSDEEDEHSSNAYTNGFISKGPFSGTSRRVCPGTWDPHWQSVSGTLHSVGGNSAYISYHNTYNKYNVENSAEQINVADAMTLALTEGHIKAGSQWIDVLWSRPGDSAELSASFAITVSEV